MDDLIVFLKARLDEDAACARAATGGTGEWWWDHGYGDMCNDRTCPYGELTERPTPGENHGGTVLMDVHGYDVKVPWQGADHIARHDPARVLREVEAKRRVFELHRPDDPDRPECVTCGPRWPCRTAKSLGTVYADHPDYREEWRP